MNISYALYVLKNELKDRQLKLNRLNISLYENTEINNHNKHIVNIKKRVIQQINELETAIQSLGNSQGDEEIGTRKTRCARR